MVAAESSNAIAQSAWVKHKDSASGVSLMYPKDWKLTPNPENDVPFKLNGTTSGGYGVELQLRTPQGDMTTSSLVNLLRENIWAKVPGYKPLSNSEVKFGQSSRFSGPMYDMNFAVGAMPIHQRWYFFRANGKTGTVVLTAPEEAWQGALTPFNQILSTFDLGKATGATSSAVTSQTRSASSNQTVATEALQDPGQPPPLQIAVPSGWKLTHEHHGEDLSWKLTGKNSSGHDAEVNVWTCQRGEFTLDKFVEVAQEEYLKPLRSYRMLRSGRRTVGGTDGVTQEMSFVADGIPGKMHAAFFIDRDRCYCVAILSATWTDEQMRSLFDRMISSVRLP